VIHLQQNQAELILFDQDSLEFRGEFGMLSERELNGFEQNDQRGRATPRYSSFR
jgi:hypothetical protein